MTQWITSASALIVAVCIGRIVLKGKISLRLQYALWAIVLVRLLVPVSFFSSAISVQNCTEKTNVAQAAQQIEIEIPVRSYDDAYADVVQTYERQGVAITSENEQSVQVEAQRYMNAEIPLGYLLRYAWYAGMAVMAVCLTAANLHFGQRLRRSRRAIEVAYAPVEVYVTDAVRTPCLYGLFRPAIYVTSEAAADEQTLRYVLAHEITHYRHFDYVWAVLRSVCLVIHWYNPLVWLASKLSRQDAELACDEGTMRFLGEEHRGDYGRTLIGLSTHTRLSDALVTATTMTGGKRELKERIVILMKHPKTKLVTMIAVVLACVLAVGCTFTGAQETTEPEETTAPAETTLPEEDPEYARIEEEITALFSGEDPWNPYCMALTSYYDDPAGVDLYAMFYNGMGSSQIPQEELALMADYSDTSILRVTGGEMETALHAVFDITLEQTRKIGLDKFTYYQPNDAYLLAHGDTNASAITIQSIVALSQTQATVAYLRDGCSCVMILAKRDDRWIIERNNLFSAAGDEQIHLPNGAVELTEAQIAAVNEAFRSERTWQEGDLTCGSVTPVNGFFQCYYSTPEEIDLVKFLRHFSAYGIVEGWNEENQTMQDLEVTEEEFQDLAQMEEWPFEHVTALAQMPLPIHKIPSEALDAVLYYYTGVHLDELYTTGKDSGLVYSEKYDAYYNFTSDFGPGYFICAGGYYTQDYAVLYSQQDTVLILREENGTYYIQSHLPLEETQLHLTNENLDDNLGRADAVSLKFLSSGEQIPYDKINTLTGLQTLEIRLEGNSGDPIVIDMSRLTVHPETVILSVSIAAEGVDYVNLSGVDEFYLWDTCAYFPDFPVSEDVQKFGIQLNDPDLTGISDALPNLTEFSANGLHTTADLSPLAGMAKLELLNLGYIDDETLATLPVLPGLRVISLRERTVTDISAVLAQPDLIQLNLYYLDVPENESLVQGVISFPTDDLLDWLTTNIDRDQLRKLVGNGTAIVVQEQTDPLA